MNFRMKNVNLKEFIASGLLEKYVFEVANEKEKEIVEEMIKRFPELKKRVSEIEDIIEFYAEKHQIKPPLDWEIRFFINHFF
mgnify:CR=1 FL=1